MIRSHKLLATKCALKALLSSMSPPVPLQFIRSREPFATVHPVANKGTLTWKELFTNKLNQRNFSIEEGFAFSVHAPGNKLLYFNSYQIFLISIPIETFLPNHHSPVCHRRCAFRWDVFPYTFLHPSIWQMCCRFRSGCRSPSLQLGHVHATRRSLGFGASSGLLW